MAGRPGSTGHLAGRKTGCTALCTPTARTGRPGGNRPLICFFRSHRALFARASNHGAASGEPRSLVN